jgi:hypothetical protein
MGIFVRHHQAVMGQCVCGLLMISRPCSHGIVFLYAMPSSQQSALGVHPGSPRLDAIWLCLMERRLESMKEGLGIRSYLFLMTK